MVNQFPVFLFSQLLRQFLLIITSDKSINHHFKNVIEILGKQKVFCLSIHGYFILPIKESITQIPYS